LKPSALTVGYLPQDGLSHTGRTVFDEATLAFRDLLAMKAEMHELEERLGDPSIPEAAHDGMLGRYADLQRPFVVWNVFATPELSVVPKEWCFPFAFGPSGNVAVACSFCPRSRRS
jgi:ATPase subunit of ABC transporter with duplicated ATPase domains